MRGLSVVFIFAENRDTVVRCPETCADMYYRIIIIPNDNKFTASKQTNLICYITLTTVAYNGLRVHCMQFVNPGKILNQLLQYE